MKLVAKIVMTVVYLADLGFALYHQIKGDYLQAIYSLVWALVIDVVILKDDKD